MFFSFSLLVYPPLYKVRNFLIIKLPTYTTYYVYSNKYKQNLLQFLKFQNNEEKMSEIKWVKRY